MKQLSGALVAVIAVWFFWPSGDNNYPVTNSPPQGNRILCIGDSLVAGVGAKSGRSYPEQLADLLDLHVSRVGKSGYTSQEFAKWLRGNSTPAADIVIVTLGGNDILKRIPWDETAQSLGYIFTTFQQQGALLVLTGVDGFIHERSDAYRDLCKTHGVYYIDDVLEPLLSEPELMADNVHPNEKGYASMAKVIAQHLTDEILVQ